MDQFITPPSLSKEGVIFTVVVDFTRHECLVTPQALYKLSAFKSEDQEVDIMAIFRAYEANINGIARRLVAAGVAGSPLVMRPETFGSPRGG